MYGSVYYSTADVEKIVGVNATVTKEIAGTVSEVIKNFGEKERRAWRFKHKEMFFIKFVSDNTKILTRVGAIETALNYFYGIEWKADKSNL